MEVVRSDDNGYLAPAGDIRGLSDGVRRLLADPDLCSRMGAAASEGLEDFDRDLMVRQQEELYRCIGPTSRS